MSCDTILLIQQVTIINAHTTFPFHAQKNRNVTPTADQSIVGGFIWYTMRTQRTHVYCT